MDSRLNLGEIPTLSDSAYQTVDSLNEVFVKGTTEPLNEKASESFLNAPEASKPLSYQDMMQLIPEKYRNAPGLPTANADGLHVDSTSSDENASKSSGQAEASYPEGFLDLLSEVLRVGPKVDSESQKRLEKEEDFSQGGNREVVKPIGVDFLEKEGEAFLKTHALNEFDFDPTPRGEWAKQILYDMKPFDNVIKSGEKVIPPSIYFSLKSPTEVELAKKLNSLTVENTLLNDFSGRSSTKLGGSRRASHPFSRPAVPLAEKGKATSQLLQFGVTPVEQNVVNQKAYDRTMKLTSLLDSDAPTEASAPVAPVAESPARISVPATEGVLDVGELRRNVPSLRSQVSSVSPRSQVSSAPVAPITPIAPVAQKTPETAPLLPASLSPSPLLPASLPPSRPAQVALAGSDRALLETLLFGAAQGQLATPRSSVSAVRNGDDHHDHDDGGHDGNAHHNDPHDDPHDAITDQEQTRENPSTHLPHSTNIPENRPSQPILHDDPYTLPPTDSRGLPFHLRRDGFPPSPSSPREPPNSGKSPRLRLRLRGTERHRPLPRGSAQLLAGIGVSVVAHAGRALAGRKRRVFRRVQSGVTSGAG